MADNQSNSFIDPDAFYTLPKDVQAAMESVDSAAILEDIARNHHLHVDQAGALAHVTGELLSGNAHSLGFENRVKEKVGVNTETAQKITEEVNNQIFKPIQLALKQMYQTDTENGGDGGEKKQEGQPVPPPPVTNETSSPKPASSDPYREPIEDDDLL